MGNTATIMKRQQLREQGVMVGTMTRVRHNGMVAAHDMGMGAAARERRAKRSLWNLVGHGRRILAVLRRSFNSRLLRNHRVHGSTAP